MDTKRLIVRLAVIAASAVLLMLGILLLYAVTGGWSFEIGLPGGYSLARISGSDVVLCSPPMSEVVLGPEIDGYAVYGRIVVGHATYSSTYRGESTPGYFLLDTKTGWLRSGLSEEQWMRLLRKCGIKGRPHLWRPTWPRFLGAL